MGVMVKHFTFGGLTENTSVSLSKELFGIKEAMEFVQ